MNPMKGKSSGYMKAELVHHKKKNDMVSVQRKVIVMRGKGKVEEICFI